MPNTLLTPTALTRESFRVLHQKLNFVGNITREYDSSFAKEGAKIGDSLKIRLPTDTPSALARTPVGSGHDRSQHDPKFRRRRALI